MNRLAVLDDVQLGNKKLSQGRVDLIEVNVGGETIDTGIDAARLRTEQKAACRKQVRQNPQIGDTPGIGIIRIIASGTLEVVTLEVVFPCRLQRPRRNVFGGPQHRISEQRPEAIVPPSANRTSHPVEVIEHPPDQQVGIALARRQCFVDGKGVTPNQLVDDRVTVADGRVAIYQIGKLAVRRLRASKMCSWRKARPHNLRKA